MKNVLRRVQQNLQIPIVSLTRPISLCVMVSAVLSDLKQGEIHCTRLPRRKWPLDISRNKGYSREKIGLSDAIHRVST